MTTTNRPRRCGIHNVPTQTGRCWTCDLDALGQDASRDREVVRHALKLAYAATHRTLDGDTPDSDELSNVNISLAVALRAMGSSGAEALGIQP